MFSRSRQNFTALTFRIQIWRKAPSDTSLWVNRR